MEALKALLDENVQSLFTAHDIYTHKELEALYEIGIEEFVHIRALEMKTLTAVIHKDVVLAVTQELTELGQMLAVVPNAALTTRMQHMSDLFEKLLAAQGELERIIDEVEAMNRPRKQAKLINDEGIRAMEAVREACDALEPMVSAKNWTLPTYDEIFTTL